MCYKICRDWHKSKENYLKASDCYKEQRSLFHAAKCYEHVISVLKETKNYLEMTEFGHRACNLYQQSGSHEAASTALEKTAKMVESECPEAALDLYRHAVDTIIVSLSRVRPMASSFDGQ